MERKIRQGSAEVLRSFILKPTRRKVLLPLHYGGYACDMNAVLQLAERQELRVVEDAVAGRILTLPLYGRTPDEDVGQVASALLEAL